MRSKLVPLAVVKLRPAKVEVERAVNRPAWKVEVAEVEVAFWNKKLVAVRFVPVALVKVRLAKVVRPKTFKVPEAARFCR